LTLATAGVALTAGLVGVAAHVLFGLGWVEALMLGAIIASTDAAAVFFLLRVGGLNLRDRVKATLEIESGANDPMAIFLTIALVELAASKTGLTVGAGLEFLGVFITQIGLGLVFGLIGGLGVTALLARLKDLDAGLYPITGLSTALIVFALSGLLGGSGFLSAYVAGVVAGNRRVRFAHRIRRFQVGMTWLAQIGMFLTLGLLATPSEMGGAIVPGLVLSFFLILVARPLAVWLCLSAFRFKWREKLFVGWVGLRGAVSIMLAILPGLNGVEGGQMFFNIIFVMVVTSLVVQGWTIGVSARVLNMVAAPDAGAVNRIEFELPGEGELELLGYRIHPDSAVAKGERIPRWARPVLILRGGVMHTIHSAGALKSDDHVYLFARPRAIDSLDRIYARASDSDDPDIYGDFIMRRETKAGDLAREYGLAPFADDPEVEIGAFIEAQHSSPPKRGDRLSIGDIDLIVHSVDEAGRVATVGLAIDPAANPENRLQAVAARRIRAALEAAFRRLRPKRVREGAGAP
jgi:cell volume regulation protein A